MIETILTLAIVALIVNAIIQRNVSKEIELKRKDDYRTLAETIQTVADKVDVDEELNEQRANTNAKSVYNLETRVAALANILGYKLENGLWMKEDVKPAAPKKAPAKKTPTSPTTKRSSANKGGKA